MLYYLIEGTKGVSFHQATKRHVAEISWYMPIITLLKSVDTTFLHNDAPSYRYFLDSHVSSLYVHAVVYSWDLSSTKRSEDLERVSLLQVL
jgi:hypothetical protein